MGAWKKWVALLACMGSLSGCYYSEQGAASSQIFAMDTVMSVEIYGDNAQAQVDQCVETIYRLEKLWDVTDEESEIWAINHSDGMPVSMSVETLALLGRSLVLCEETGGALDITTYPAVEAWGFTTGDYRVPSQEELDALVERIDYQSLFLDPVQGVASLPQGYAIDMGAVAKGYTGQYLASQLEKAGVTSALLYLGGNVQTIGHRQDGQTWKIGIQDPTREEAVALGTIEAANQAVVTSGSYQRYFEENGQTYFHILDPDTAAPARTGLTSVTILGKEGLVCDALSTALFVMGLEEGAEFWRDHPDYDVEVLWVEEDGSLTMTPGFHKGFQLAKGQESRSITVLEP